jgi:serine protease Do
MRPEVLLGLLCLALVPAGARADPTPVKRIEDRPPVSVADKEKIAPVVFARIRSSLATNESLGTREDGIFCRPRGNFIMTSKTWDAVRRGALRAFRAELSKAGYPNPFQEESTFDDKPREPAEFEVGALVRKVQVNLCIKGKEVVGGAYVEAKWELYSKKARKVVFEAVTEGSYQSSAPEIMLFEEWFERAFAVSVRNMLAERKFGDILAGAVALPAAEAQPAAERIMLTSASAPQGGVGQNATMLRAAVVTVSSGKVSGSGFFVSPDGYLLTNQHVVGDVKFVKVKLATGRELVGEVIRTDRKRDVALLKTEAIGASTLAIRITEPNIGEELYAIGSPFGDKFSGSITRGILSGHRMLDELRYLQSDVAVLPGSSGGPLIDTSGKVVGIAKGGIVSGMGNLNLFIPIAEAVSILSLEIRE